jgi:hypothetical protein
MGGLTDFYLVVEGFGLSGYPVLVNQPTHSARLESNTGRRLAFASQEDADVS